MTSDSAKLSSVFVCASLATLFACGDPAANTDAPRQIDPGKTILTNDAGDDLGNPDPSGNPPGGPSADAAVVTPPPTDPCGAMCANAVSAKCSMQSGCVIVCQHTVAGDPAPCQAQRAALLACGKTTTTFTCDSQGLPSIGGCDSQTQALNACIQAQSQTADAGTDPGDDGDCSDHGRRRRHCGHRGGNDDNSDN